MNEIVSNVSMVTVVYISYLDSIIYKPILQTLSIHWICRISHIFFLKGHNLHIFMNHSKGFKKFESCKIYTFVSMDTTTLRKLPHHVLIVSDNRRPSHFRIGVGLHQPVRKNLQGITKNASFLGFLQSRLPSTFKPLVQ